MGVTFHLWLVSVLVVLLCGFPGFCSGKQLKHWGNYQSKTKPSQNYKPCGRHKCLNEAECSGKTFECTCPSGTVGKGHVQCAGPDSTCLCTIWGDPHVINFREEGFTLPLSCSHVIADLTTPPTHKIRRGCKLFISGRARYPDNGPEDSAISFENAIFVTLHTKNSMFTTRIDRRGFTETRLTRRTSSGGKSRKGGKSTGGKSTGRKSRKGRKSTGGKSTGGKSRAGRKSTGRKSVKGWKSTAGKSGKGGKSTGGQSTGVKSVKGGESAGEKSVGGAKSTGGKQKKELKSRWKRDVKGWKSSGGKSVQGGKSLDIDVQTDIDTANFHRILIPACGVSVKFRPTDGSFSLQTPIRTRDHKGLCGPCSKRWKPPTSHNSYKSHMAVLKLLLASLQSSSPIDNTDINIYPSCTTLTKKVRACPVQKRKKAVKFCGEMLINEDVRTCLSRKLGKKHVQDRFTTCYDAVCTGSSTCSDFRQLFSDCGDEAHLDKFLNRPNFC